MIYDNASYNLVGSKGQDFAPSSLSGDTLQGRLSSVDPTKLCRQRAFTSITCGALNEQQSVSASQRSTGQPRDQLTPGFKLDRGPVECVPNRLCAAVEMASKERFHHSAEC